MGGSTGKQGSDNQANYSVVQNGAVVNIIVGVPVQNKGGG